MSGHAEGTGIDENYNLRPQQGPVSKNPPPCTHSKLNLYTDPCFVCHKYCNCDLTKEWPDVLLLSLDRKTVRLSSLVVRGSPKLQCLVEKHRERKLKEVQVEIIEKSFQGLEVHEGERINLRSDKDSEGGSGTGNKGSQVDGVDLTLDDWADEEEEGTHILHILDLMDYKDNVVFDLRTEDNVPNFGISAETYNYIQKYMALHLDQVEEAVVEEQVAALDFVSGEIPRPRKKPSNHFAYEDWEEYFFNVDTVTFLNILQAKFELAMWDLHYAVEKWILLFRGRPAMDDFGKGHYLWGPPNMYDDSGCQDFYVKNKKVSNPRRRSPHSESKAYLANRHGYIFPRSFQWKRTRR